MTHHDARAELKRPERHASGQPKREGSGRHHAPEGHGEANGHGGEHQGMAQLAEGITRHYDEPAPKSEPPTPEPFPPGVMHGLAAGAFQGAALGTIFGFVLATTISSSPAGS